MIRCTLANSAWQLAAMPEALRFEKALRHPEDAQDALLRGLVDRNGHTRFGREHGFDGIRSVAEYRERVPLRDYEAFVPWIDRIRRGEEEVLTADPVTRLLPTGGSSGGAEGGAAGGRKLIPWTASLGRDFRRALAPWVTDLFRQNPDLKRGPAYWSLSAATGDAGHAPDDERSAVPIDFDGDSSYLGGALDALIRPTLAVPGSVARIADVEAFQYATLLALLRCRELRLVSVWHPSFFGLLLDRMEEEWERLVADIGGGVGPPDSARAAELRRLGPHALDRIWPRLGLISCWMDAGAGPSARALHRRIPHVPMQGKGLLATEGFSSIPFRGACPLAIRSHFFEFIDEDGAARMAHELAEGRTYSLVLSTSGGLYRYQTHDRVQVTGRVSATPSLRFVGRGDRVSDLRGEKLTDGFVQQVLERLFASGPGETGRPGPRGQPGETDMSFAMLAPSGDDTCGAGSTGYTLFVEPPSVTDRSLGTRLDALLSENPQYRLARGLGQLAAPEVFTIPERAHRIYLEAQAARGRRLGDIKPVALDTRTDWRAVFESRALPAPGPVSTLPPLARDDSSRGPA